jgi:hypothetical protein
MGKTKYDWSQADLLLGTMPDSKLGRMFGIPTTSVYRRRRSRGIRAYGKRSGGDKYADILGQISDEAVARIAGVTVETARNPCDPSLGSMLAGKTSNDSCPVS